MSNKIIYLLGGIFGLLLIFVTQPYWSSYLTQSKLNSGNNTQAKLVNDLRLIEFSSDTQEPLTLSLLDNQWQINQFLADQSLVQQLLDDLRLIELDTIVSTNPDNFAEFDATESAKKLRLESSTGQIQEYFIGVIGTRPGTVYLRPVNENLVYQVRSQLTSFAFAGVDQWRDKTILNLSKDQIKQIIFTRTGRQVVVEADEAGQWTATFRNDKRVIGEVALERMFDVLSPLQAVGFADEAEQRRFSSARNKTRIELIQTDDSQIQLELVENPDARNWLVKSDQAEEIMILTQSSVNDLIDNTLAIFD